MSLPRAPCAGKVDNIVGPAQGDALKGMAGASYDQLFDESGKDRLYGNSGNDHLDGGVGSDRRNGDSPRRGNRAANCEMRTHLT
jgi:Ca2+-binding RTX toxin-like protein